MGARCVASQKFKTKCETHDWLPWLPQLRRLPSMWCAPFLANLVQQPLVVGVVVVVGIVVVDAAPFTKSNQLTGGRSAIPIRIRIG